MRREFSAIYYASTAARRRVIDTAGISSLGRP